MDTQTLKEIKNSKKLREAFKKEYTKTSCSKTTI